MYSIVLSRVIEHLQASDCKEIINELTPISGIKVYEVDKDQLIRVAQTLVDISEGIKDGTIFIKVYNGKIEKCGSFTTLLRNIVSEYYTRQNKEIIAKAFKDHIEFY